MDVSKQVSSVKVRSAVAFLGCIWIVVFGYSYFSGPKHKFMTLDQENIDNQWGNLETLLVASRHHVVPLLLFDIDILPNVFVARDKAWKNTLHLCKILCKHHPEEKNVITFAALATKFMSAQKEYVASLEQLGFTVHLSEVPDPRQRKIGKREMIPSYLWMARKSHVIHIAFLHERGNDIKYMWVGPVTDRSWSRTVKAIAPAIGEGWHSLDAIGAKFPRYAQAYDLSHKFTGFPVYLDGHRISVPYHITAFLKEYSLSRFTECNYRRADEYIAEFQTTVPKYDQLFQEAAKTMLAQTKMALEKIDISFWLTGGTLLGWYRQCEVIPYDTNVDIGIWDREYKDDIVQEMQDVGFFFKSRFGKPRGGLEMLFLDKSGFQLRLHFFIRKDNVVNNVRTRQKDGKRFQFTYNPLQFCWTEFVGLKVQVPCDTLGYIQMYFGDGWHKPNKDWVWSSNAKNIIYIGEWDKKQQSELMEIHYRKFNRDP